MEELIESILPFIRAKCRKYAISEGQNVEDSEAYSDALEYAVRCAINYDPAEGITFLSYCGNKLPHELKRRFLKRKRHLMHGKALHWIGEIDLPETLRDSVNADELAALAESISTLQDEQQQILLSGKSCRELARELGVSHEVANRRKRVALELVRCRLIALGFGE